jgi:transcriptional regulator with XRE-family HTH domain
MARPPKRPHALRTTLKILGLTQVQLAKRLGIAPVTIEKFLNGVSTISEELAMRISNETGLDFEQLVLNGDPLNPRRADGSALLPHRAVRTKTETRAQRQARLKRIARFVRALVNASLQAWVEADDPKKFNFQVKLRMRLPELLKEFGLDKRTAELMGLEGIGLFSADISGWLRRAKSARKPKRQPL